MSEIVRIVGAAASRNALASCAAALALLALCGCSVDMGGFSFTKDKKDEAPAAATATIEGPHLAPDGRCTDEAAASRARPQSIEIGISECDLVRLKGQPADVLIGNDGKGNREVQVLYQDPTGKKLYLFSANKLARIVD